MTVDPYIVERRRSLDTEHGPAVAPVGGHGKLTSVAADLVTVGRDIRRIFFEIIIRRIELISRVDINLRSIALSLPVAGHLDFIPSVGAVIGTIKVLRTHIGRRRPLEIPFAVERHIPRRTAVTLISYLSEHIRLTGIGHNTLMRVKLPEAQGIRILPVRQLLGKNR